MKQADAIAGDTRRTVSPFDEVCGTSTDPAEACLTSRSRMSAEAFLQWRKGLGYSRYEAAQKLGVHRGTIRHWENGSTRIPSAIELACFELTRRWKQRLDFGPVVLIYGSEPLWHPTQDSLRTFAVQCERHLTNQSVVERMVRLARTVKSMDGLVLDESGDLIWRCAEVLRRFAASAETAKS